MPKSARAKDGCTFRAGQASSRGAPVFLTCTASKGAYKNIKAPLVQVRIADLRCMLADSATPLPNISLSSRLGPLYSLLPTYPHSSLSLSFACPKPHGAREHVGFVTRWRVYSIGHVGEACCHCLHLTFDEGFSKLVNMQRGLP